MSIELTVVGCSGSYEGPGEPASCYLVTVPGKRGKPFRILIDCGNGALSNLHKVIDPSHIDNILISHLHADHFLDLAGLEVYLAYHPLVNCPTVRVFAPEGIDERLSAATGNPDPIPPGASRAPLRVHCAIGGGQHRSGACDHHGSARGAPRSRIRLPYRRGRHRTRLHGRYRRVRGRLCSRKWR